MIKKFIEIEGNDGCGKGLLVSLIEDHLKNEYGAEVVKTREPGGTLIAERIRQIAKSNEFDGVEDFSDKTELLLMFAARNQLVSNVIRPALENSKWVISDRFTSSTYAYQGYARGLDISKIKILEDMIVDDTKPSLTMILDCPPEVSLARAKGRGELDRLEREHIDFFKRSRNGYLELAKMDPVKNRIINANQPIEKVHKDALNIFKNWHKENF